MNPNNKDQDQLLHLAANLAEDALTADISDLEQELVDEGTDKATVLASMRAIIGRARMNLAKASREEMARGNSSSGPKVSIDPVTARAKLEAIAASKPGLMMAARKGESVTDSDAVSALQQMLRLGLITEDDLE
jgi:hypothetical protein